MFSNSLQSQADGLAYALTPVYTVLVAHNRRYHAKTLSKLIYLRKRRMFSSNFVREGR